MCPYSAQPAEAAPVTTAIGTGHRLRQSSASRDTASSQVNQSACRYSGSFTAASGPVNIPTTATTSTSTAPGGSARSRAGRSKVVTASPYERDRPGAYDGGSTHTRPPNRP
ncbi:hypothetical protein G6048_07685 [Streptomyces sp. YC419]|uniref:Uncharacterized protein n=1 Tax=Streptomyces ureilyticus TaxID=1775131 RepID=A0ABX0DJP3_9ACTN|nr:hypothetical protein [Streptomyces ureilyticus]NGO42051.1 hypothetical protein [Streptomyces ureilyticus]